MVGTSYDYSAPISQLSSLDQVFKANSHQAKAEQLDLNITKRNFSHNSSESHETWPKLILSLMEHFSRQTRQYTPLNFAMQIRTLAFMSQSTLLPHQRPWLHSNWMCQLPRATSPFLSTLIILCWMGGNPKSLSRISHLGSKSWSIQQRKSWQSRLKTNHHSLFSGSLHRNLESFSSPE